MIVIQKMIHRFGKIIIITSILLIVNLLILRRSADAMPTIIITELMASNSNILADEDGDFSDWIEIYNPTTIPVNLVGWKLQDNGISWTFPSHSLNAGDTVLVWASGKNRAISGQPLHTNFKLKTSGEYLGLIAPDETVSYGYEPSYPPQISNISYGIDPDEQLVFFDDPTPNMPNTFPVLSNPVLFSIPHGYYTTTQNVVLTSSTSATIHYTIDGSTPTSSSPVYTAPITINSSTIIRARTYSADGESKLTTHTYLFMDDVLAQDETPPAGWPLSEEINYTKMDYGFNQSDVAANRTLISDSLLSLPTLSLVTDIENLFDQDNGIYVNPEEEGRAWERPASLELFDPSENEEGFAINAGVRIRGGASRSRTNPRHNWRLFFRSEYGDISLDYPIFGDEGDDKFDKIDLRAPQNYSWAWRGDDSVSFVRELWSRDTQGDLGHPHTRTDYYHLYVNGQYWGIYQTQERLTKEYAESYLGGDEDEYDVMKIEWDVAAPNLQYATASDGNDTAWRSLWNLISDETISAAEYEIIEDQVDLANLVDYYLIFFLTGDYDNAPMFRPVSGSPWSMSNNWYAVRNRVDGKWQFFDHDSEASLCHFGIAFGANDLNPNGNTGPWPIGADNPAWGIDRLHPGWLHQALLSNDNYVQLFRDRVQKHLVNPDGLLRPAANMDRINARLSVLNPAIDAHAARWGDTIAGKERGRADWEAQVEFIRDVCLAQRPDIVLAQLADDGLTPILSPPNVTSANNTVAYADIISLIHNNDDGTIYYTTDGSDPRGVDNLPTDNAIESDNIIINDYVTTLIARVYNGAEWSAPSKITYIVTSSSIPTTIVVNEYNAVDKDSGTWSGVDLSFVDDPRNGGDWIEFALVQDADLRNWSIELWEQDNNLEQPEITDLFVFSNNNLLSNLKSGTILTLSEDHAEDITYNPSVGDWKINIQASSDTISALLTSTSNNNFNVNHKGFQVVIRDANGDIVSPSGMGETDRWDAENGNVSSSEIMVLCTTPSKTIDVIADYADEKQTSTFGEPNICDGSLQDFSSLRIVEENTPIPTATNTRTPRPTATNTRTPRPTATNTRTPRPTATNTRTPRPTVINTQASRTNIPLLDITNTPIPIATSTSLPRTSDASVLTNTMNVDVENSTTSSTKPTSIMLKSSSRGHAIDLSSIIFATATLIGISLLHQYALCESTEQKSSKSL